MTAPAQSEWRANWPLLLCCLIGIPVPMVASYTLGQFLGPLEHEFGWSRTQASAGLSISLILGFIATPVVGRLVDTVNARRLVLPGIVLVGLAFAAFSLATSSAGFWIALWCFISVSGTLVSATVWVAVLNAAFDKYRSLAVSIALCGSGLAAGLGPTSARLLIDGYGWRTAFQLLGLIWTVPALLLSLACFFDRRPLGKHTPAANEHADTPTVAKPPLGKILRSGNFIKLALAIAAAETALAAYMIHLAPALADKGLSLDQAAFVAGLAGLLAIPGKLGVGWFFDRVGSTPVCIGIMVLFAAASALLAIDSSSMALAVAASGLVGISAGALLAYIACITSQLFDASVFGVVFGSLMSLCAFGGAVGPLGASAIHDATGSYASAFWAGIGVAVVAGLLLVSLKAKRTDYA